MPYSPVAFAAPAAAFGSYDAPSHAGEHLVGELDQVERVHAEQGVGQGLSDRGTERCAHIG